MICEVCSAETEYRPGFNYCPECDSMYVGLLPSASIRSFKNTVVEPDIPTLKGMIKSLCEVGSRTFKIYYPVNKGGRMLPIHVGGFDWVLGKKAVALIMDDALPENYSWRFGAAAIIIVEKNPV